MNSNKSNKSLVSLILRVSFGSMMLTHGYGKFLKLFSDDTSFADPLGIGELPTLIIAVLGEFISPLMLIAGIKTKWASILPALTMLVAAFMVHGDDPWRKQELPLLYFFGFLSIYLLGSGKYSLDWKLKKV